MLVEDEDQQDSGSDHTESDSDSTEQEQRNYQDYESDSEETESVESNQLDQDSESEAESEISDPFIEFTGNGMMVRVHDETSLEYRMIVKGFVDGMETAGGVTQVAAVHKKSVTHPTGAARFGAFKVFADAVGKKCGGNPNIKYTWFRGTKEEIREILVHGFTSKDGDGCGRIRLVPIKFPLEAAIEEVGDDGLRHLLMCGVILGKVELVDSGSKQVVPSSDEFDCGVDKVSRRYLVWSSFMNSHLFPAYVVSFKGPASLKGHVTISSGTDAASVVSALTQGSSGPAKTAGIPARVTLAGLAASLTRFLTPREMKIVVGLLNDFRAKKISGEELKQKVRLVAGDRLISGMKLLGSGDVPVVDGSVRDIYIPGLIAVLAGLLPALKTAMLCKRLDDFKAKKITRLQLISSLRGIVGNDNVLIAAIGSYRMRKQQQQQKKSHV